MGLVASQARLLMLTMTLSDVEFQMQTISQEKMMLANSTSGIATQESQLMMNSSSGTTSNNPQYIAAVNYLQSRLQMAQSADKYLDMIMNQLETREKEISTEIESVQKIIDKNVERSFKYMS